MSDSRQKRLPRGTACLVKCSTGFTGHDGKVVQVERYLPEHKGYLCSPDLMDPRNGERFAWVRASLVPLPGGHGQDEMLRITGKPKKTRPKQRVLVGAKGGN